MTTSPDSDYEHWKDFFCDVLVRLILMSAAGFFVLRFLVISFQLFPVGQILVKWGAAPPERSAKP
ncbi:MAG TPA: hypothetical protein VGZ22_15780 [Isosphaeraceae bacterium]|nr:hypothetical protein [Isosphaeraceae bacterium]